MDAESSHWRRVVEALPHAVWTTDRDGVVDYVSPKLSEFTGIPPHQLLGWGWLAALHPDDRPTSEAAWARAVGSRGEILIERRFRRADGEYRRFSCHGVPVQGTNGVAGWVGTSVEVMDRVRGEWRWRTYMETLPQLIWAAAPDGTVDYMSAQACAYTGMPEETLLGDGWTAMIHPDDREATSRLLASIAAQQPSEVQHRLRRADGEYRWFTTRAEPARDDAGRILKWVGGSTEITSFKQLEADLLHTKERLEIAIRSSNMSIWEYDMPDGRLDSARESLTNVWESLGYDETNAPASVMHVIHPDDRDRMEAAVKAYLTGSSPRFEAEHRILHHDGSHRWVLGRGVALREHADATAVRFIGTSVDITERKRIEEDLRRAREAAEAANQAKDAFLANVSHEIRTPMNAILGMTEVALESTPTEEQRQLLSTVRSAARNLLGIINDLLDYSKITAGKVTLDKSDFCLRSEVNETLRALFERGRRKGLELGCHIHPDVPDALFGDAGRLRQVLTNLVGNALKFTASGAVMVELSAQESPRDVMLVFEVRDTGIGIARDQRAKIFRAFEQGDATTTRHYGGTGLGLTISSQLAALMDGEITVDSDLGRGSTFTFTARLERSMRAPASSESARREHTTRTEHPLRILVAEDNEFNIALLRTLLGRRGHHTQFAEDGALALQMASKSTFDVLLLDLHMPEMDGFEVVRRIREREQPTGRHLPIVAITARSSSRDRERCLAAGMDDFVTKPIDASLLWTVLDRVTGSRPGPVGSARLLDVSAIVRACDGDGEIFEQLCDAFRRSVPEQIASVRQALLDHDLVVLGDAARRLNGTLSTFSTTAGALASTVEDAARRDDLENSAALVGQLSPMCAALLSELRDRKLDDIAR